MSRIKQSSRARGSNRGGVGGGYEPLDPDFDIKRIQRLRAEYDSLDGRWRDTYIKGLNRSDAWYVLNREP